MSKEEVVEERVEPAPLSIALLYKILRHLEETTLEGIDVPLPEPTVTSVKPEIIDVAHVPLRSVYFFNKGPNTVYYRVNDDATEIPLEDKENITVKRPKRTIVKITLRVNVGETATVKMIGQY